jgi:Protein of unknown function (DUF3667)
VTGGVVTADTRCANCQTPLVGPFCSNCGQRHEPHMHSMSEFASETFESFTHADSRLWRTLWLLISKPGFLTVEFLEGRRARYLPPFRLYLVLSVVLFLVAATVNHKTVVIGVGVSTDDSGAVEGVRLETAAGANETPQQRAERVCEGANFEVGPKSWEPKFREGCRKVVLDGGKAFIESFYHNLPRALFLLLPIMALAMKLLYWRRYYVEHLLFFIHNHAFTFVLFTLFSLFMAITSWAWLIVLYVLIVLFYPPIYTYRAMRRVYPQRRWITRLKFVALACVYLVFVVAIAIFTSVYSLLTL